MASISKTGERRWTLWGMPSWVVLAVGIPASFFLFAFLQNSIENVARLRFEREANDANGIIADRLRSYSDVL